MALVKIDQSVLDEFGTQLSTIADEVQKLVDDESNPLSDADVSGITGPLARINTLFQAPTTPVDGSDDGSSTPPADSGSDESSDTPVSDGGDAADSGEQIAPVAPV